MTKPCAVFWDIKNVGVPKGQTFDFIVDLIRSTIIKPHNLNEIFFFCVHDINELPSNVCNSLTNLVFQAYDGREDSADIKITGLMRKFVKLAGNDCTIILLSGEGDYYGTLCDLNKLHSVFIHLVGLANNSFSPELYQISDYTFILDNGVLKLIESTSLPMYFISIDNYPDSIDLIYLIMHRLNTLTIGSIENSAILYDRLICIAFPTLWKAERAIEQLNESIFHGYTLKAELIDDSTLTKILKCIKPNVTVQTKRNTEVKDLTYIKLNNSKQVADMREIIKFCIACTAQSGSQCILTNWSNLWIVFSYLSDALNCLPKVQMLYPKACISETPFGLTFSGLRNSEDYTVESCEQKVEYEALPQVDHSNIASFRPEKARSSQDLSPSIDRYVDINASADIEHKASKELITTYAEFQNPMSYDNECKIFFRHSPLYHLTKWSLLYNLFEQLYDLGAKKVMFDGNLYCAHFDCVAAYQDASKKMRLRYLEPITLTFKDLETRKQEVTKKMNQYISKIPWCLNEELNLYCLVVKIESPLHSNFLEETKQILGNRECIFIKSIPGEIWIGFPDELICHISKVMLSQSYTLPNGILVAIPSNGLLKSINFQDLVGDAYDLAFLSSQLDGSKPITSARIIEQISLDRTEKEKCNGEVFSITIKGNFNSWMSWSKLSLEQIVKIFVKFSKVIPVAATASYDEVNLMFNSWYEAHAARHFINNLTSAEVPYFTELNRVNGVQQQQLPFPSIFEYYVINDERKVLEKIIRKKRLVNRVDSNSSKVQSTSDVDVLDVEMISKLKFVFIVTSNSGFKFTRGMISIIKMNLVSMDCPACIEFEDQIWVGVDDLEKGNKAKAKIEKIKFMLLHDCESDFEVGVLMKLSPNIPTKVAKMMANELINPPKTLPMNSYCALNAVPLAHFNYNYREAVGISIKRYFELLFN